MDVILESRYSVTVHHPIYLVFHPTQTSHFAALAIIFRNSWGNSQATSEAIYCLIGKWSLGNEICWCPVTHPLPFILKVFLFGSSHIWPFIQIVKTKEICVFLLKLLPSLNSCGYRSQSFLHMVSVLLIFTRRPSVWVHKCFSISFFITLPPLLFFPLLLITHTSFPPLLLLEFFSFPLLRHSCHTQNLCFFPPEIKKKCMSSGGRHVCGGEMQNITCPVFFPRGFVFILCVWRSSKHMHTCNVSFRWNSLKISINLPDFSETQDSWALTVSVQGVFLHAFESLKYTKCTAARNKPNG